MNRLKVKLVLLIASLLAGASFAGGADVVARNGRRVVMNECRNCPMRLKFAPDGRTAFVNVARLADDSPDAATLENRKAAMTERAFKLMDIAESTRTGDRRLRPLMGWSSWNTFGLNISDQLIVEIAKTMATNGLKAAGYNYVNIDDGFFDGRDEQGNLKVLKSRFPNGLKPVVDEIHALGLKAGIYSDAGSNTCGSLWGGGLTGGKSVGGRGAGLYGHDAADCKFHFLHNGFDFIKVDYCGGIRQKLDERTRYGEIAAAIRATGRSDVRLNACRWMFPGAWIVDVAGSWRTTSDIRANFASIRGILFLNLYLGAYIKPGHYNDMDMMEVGQLTGRFKAGYAEDTGLSEIEEATHFGMWCFLSSPLLIGCDIRRLPESSKELMTNPYLLAMNQNDLAAPPYVVQHGESGVYQLVKDADSRFSTARYLAVYNPTDRPCYERVDFATLDLGGKVAVMDLMERADLGEFAATYVVDVPAHGAKFYRLDAERRLDRVVYEAESAFLSEYNRLHPDDPPPAAWPNTNATASCGAYVTNLGTRPGNDLVFRDVRVTKGGVRRFTIVCSTPEARALSVQIDSGKPMEFKVEATGKNWRQIGFDANLTPGMHVIRLFNANAMAPDIDSLRID